MASARPNAGSACAPSVARSPCIHGGYSLLALQLCCRAAHRRLPGRCAAPRLHLPPSTLSRCLLCSSIHGARPSISSAVMSPSRPKLHGCCASPVELLSARVPLCFSRSVSISLAARVLHCLVVVVPSPDSSAPSCSRFLSSRRCASTFELASLEPVSPSCDTGCELNLISPSYSN
jgi:hypothetical protein